MSFELCMEIECPNASLNVWAASKDRKNCIMKAEINFLLSKPTQVPVLLNPLHQLIVTRWLREHVKLKVSLSLNVRLVCVCMVLEAVCSYMPLPYKFLSSKSLNSKQRITMLDILLTKPPLKFILLILLCANNIFSRISLKCSLIS